MYSLLLDTHKHLWVGNEVGSHFAVCLYCPCIGFGDVRASQEKSRERNDGTMEWICLERARCGGLCIYEW